MFDIVSGLKYRKLNIKSELIKYYKLMPEKFYEDQTEVLDRSKIEHQCARQAEGIYKIGYKAISLMVFLCQCQYYNNINYYDLLGSVLYTLKN